MNNDLKKVTPITLSNTKKVMWLDEEKETELARELRKSVDEFIDKENRIILEELESLGITKEFLENYRGLLTLDQYPNKKVFKFDRIDLFSIDTELVENMTENSCEYKYQFYIKRFMKNKIQKELGLEQ